MSSLLQTTLTLSHVRKPAVHNIKATKSVMLNHSVLSINIVYILLLKVFFQNDI